MKDVEIEQVLNEDLDLLKNKIEHLFKKGNIVRFTVLGMSLEEVVDAEFESISYDERRTPEMRCSETKVAVAQDKKKLIFLPQQEPCIHSGDSIYLIEDKILMFENARSHAGKFVYVYEHKPTEAELFGISRNNN